MAFSQCVRGEVSSNITDRSGCTHQYEVQRGVLVFPAFDQPPLPRSEPGGVVRGDGAAHGGQAVLHGLQLLAAAHEAEEEVVRVGDWPAGARAWRGVGAEDGEAAGQVTLSHLSPGRHRHLSRRIRVKSGKSVTLCVCSGLVQAPVSPQGSTR